MIHLNHLKFFSRDYKIVVQDGTSYLDYFTQATEQTNRNGWRVRVII